MMKFLKSALEGLRGPVKDDGADDPLRAQAPLAALLVRAARSNSDYDPRQVAMIESVLSRRLGIGAAQSNALRSAAETFEARTGDTVHLTRAVKDLVPLDDRPELLRDIWRVILADGARHAEEDGLMRLVSSLLGLADRESAFARQAVQREAQTHTA
ncbi:MAG: TerB family tellurite resistance protein [Rhodobacteraceae bacterium]|nr:TerB family tellurite resistance protein [Paracoccaceae bacterium]TVR45336.1 MAG: TerB family tellurite resistance protein [Paracoccaceae bacterium]